VDLNEVVKRARKEKDPPLPPLSPLSSMARTLAVGRDESDMCAETFRPHRTLAVMGAPPTFAESLHVGRPNVGNRDRFTERVVGMLDRQWFTNNGPLVQEFEQRVAKLTGVRHCVAMCNATIALEIAIRALDLRGEVIVPAYTFVATAHALQWQEITPVFADIDPATLNIAPASIESLITPQTTGILGVHVWGRVCDVDAIEAIATKHRLKVLYDAAHAFGCSRRGRMVGGFGACEVFSFHATKFLNCFEGGAVVTDDDALAEKLRLMRNFGFAGYDRVIYLGTNGKMTEVCAAMGLTSLEAMEEIIAINRRNYEAYRSGLRGVPGLSVIHYDAAELNNYQYVVVQIDPALATLNRDEIVAVLHAENILARKYFWPGCHAMEPYRSLQPNVKLLLPETERLAGNILLLPTGQAVSEEAVDLICDIISTACSTPALVRRALAASAPPVTVPPAGLTV
jgi:dTDP-4-amino-4,6-dideoxygalactose transaminase